MGYHWVVMMTNSKITGNLGFVATTVEAETGCTFGILMEDDSFKSELHRLMDSHNGAHTDILSASIAIGNDLAAFANANLI